MHRSVERLVLTASAASVALYQMRMLRRAQIQASTNRACWDLVRCHAGDVVWEMDPDGLMTYLNNSATEMFGAPPEELVGNSFLTVVHPDDRARASGILERCIERRVGWRQIRLRALRPDGTSHWVQTSGIPRLTRHGDLIGFTGTTHYLRGSETEHSAREQRRERIEDVLRTRRIAIHLQPIFSLESGMPVGAEALCRFPLEPVQTPDRWFDDAHDVGLGVDLELLAVRTALETAAALSADQYISINVSPVTLSSPALVNAMRTAPSPRLTVLELTEHISVEDYEAIAPIVTDLRGIGVRFAVDDVGAGFSSFRHVVRMNPEIIKIDQAITRDIDVNAAHRALAAAVVMYALEVGTSTIIAEGVETRGELETLAALGLDGAQGYFLGRPSPGPWSWDRIDTIRTVAPE